MSSHTTFPNVFDELVTGDPAYDELVSMYQTLQVENSRDIAMVVAEHALATVIRDMIDYLDFVGEELEKSVGITRSEERERVLDALEYPEGSSSIEEVYDFLQQWKAVELYTFADAHPPAVEDSKESLEYRV